MKTSERAGRSVNLPVPAEITEKGREGRSVNILTDKRLAYYDNAQVWWCEHCRIVCANEEVLDRWNP